MTIDSSDPRPVLRQELARVFKNQRVIRAFEKIFDLIPPEFIDQQILIETASFAAELANSQSTQALAAVDRLTEAVEKLAMLPPIIASIPSDDVGPPDFQYSISIGLETTSIPYIDQSIVPTWTGVHTFAKNATGAPASGASLYASALSSGVAATFYGPTTGAAGFNIDFYDTSNSAYRGFIGFGTSTVGGAAVTDLGISPGAAGSLVIGTANGVAIGTRFGPNGNVTVSAPSSGQTLTLAPSPAAGELIATSSALTTGAGASVGTLNNAPAAGNPTKWIKINDNGTVRSVPAW